jgi:multidrug resistance efflux pump
LVQNVGIKDNEQVHVGQVLFQVDPARFRLALEAARAILQQRTTVFVAAQREATRYQKLTNLSISTEQKQQRQAAQQANAALKQAIVDEKTAQLNLDGSSVRASVKGFITNLDLCPGDYVTAGKAVSALVDSDNFRVEGYFEKTKLRGSRFEKRLVFTSWAGPRSSSAVLKAARPVLPIGI